MTPPCANCAGPLHRPAFACGRVFCSTGCQYAWTTKHPAIVRGYRAAGLS